MTFARTTGLARQSPTIDNAYLNAWIQPPGGTQVGAIRGKAPISVHGTPPQPWPSRRTDVRYWSFCTDPESPDTLVVANHPRAGVCEPAACALLHAIRR